jgi:peptidoglycan/xylan/chitin deacetylase (PgdA/CDA1 family)
MRLTRYQWIITATLLAAVLIIMTCSGALCLLWLSLLCSVSGLCVGLGVSFPQWQLFGKSLCRVQTERKLVALTFDDGPDPESTPALLDLLARRNIRATFFCVGERVVSQPELARRIVAGGHAIENHSHRHQFWTNLLAEEKLEADLAQAQEAIRRVSGRTPAWFRPPMGLTNPRVFRVARKLGLGIVGYTARGLDRRADGPEQIVARLQRGLRPGAILLLHDGGVPAARLTATVTALMDMLQTEGYHCVRLDELVTGVAKS